MLVDDVAAIEMKNYNLVTDVDGLIRDIVKQAIKHNKHLPQGIKQVFKIDARGQVCEKALENMIQTKIVSKTGNILKAKDIRFIKDKK